MSHSEPWQRDLEGALRRALCMAADSVEPGADGLDQIRSRIRARRQLPSGWHMAELAGPAGLGSFVRNLLSAGTAARAALHAAARLFRPGADRIGGYRWLRPAAALATGVFVVLAITWAITGLPQIVTSSASNGSVPGSAGGGVPVAGGSGPAGLRTGSQSPVMSPSSSSPASYPGRYHGSTASARPPSASPTVPASSSPSASPTPPAGSSPSASPTPSASSSPAVSPTPSASCSPSGSPTPSGSSSPPGGKHCHHRGRHKQR